MYLQIDLKTLNKFNNFTLFLNQNIRIDSKDNAGVLIEEIRQSTNFDTLIPVLSKVYEGIIYDKVKFPLSDLSNVLMWVGMELALPKLYKSLQGIYESKKDRAIRRSKEIYEAQLQKQKEKAEIKRKIKEGVINVQC